MRHQTPSDYPFIFKAVRVSEGNYPTKGTVVSVTHDDNEYYRTKEFGWMNKSNFKKINIRHYVM